MGQINLKWVLGMRPEYQSNKGLKKKPNFIYLISAKCITNFLLILKKERWEESVPPPLGAKWTSSQKFITSRYPTCFPDTSVSFNSILVTHLLSSLGLDHTGRCLRGRKERLQAWVGMYRGLVEGTRGRNDRVDGQLVRGTGNISRVQGPWSPPSLSSLWALELVVNLLGLQFSYLKNAYSR